jgi:hypothetical protein
MADTAPPGTLLLVYILAEHPDSPLTREDLQAEVADVTGDRLADSTLHCALERLLEQDRVELADTNPRAYRAVR